MSIAEAPLETAADPGAPVTRGVVNCAAYCAGRRVADVAIADISEVVKREDHFVWVGLVEPEESLLREVQREFGLHDLAVEDAHKAHQRPKVEQFGDSLFVVLRTAQTNAQNRIEFGETHVFAGKRYVVTVRHGSLKSHVGLRAQCEASPHLLAKGPGYVLYALMDFVVDQYFPIIQMLEEETVALEERIFGDRSDRATTGRIYELKRDLLAVKRAVSPLVDMANRIMRLETAIIPEEARVYFRDIYDHAVRMNDLVDTLRELLTTALEANLSLVAVSQNEDTKRLAAWAAIIAVPTMIAGIYGMNFRYIPELAWAHGYAFSLGLMVAVCLLLYWGFKRSGWL